MPGLPVDLFHWDCTVPIKLFGVNLLAKFDFDLDRHLVIAHSDLSPFWEETELYHYNRVQYVSGGVDIVSLLRVNATTARENGVNIPRDMEFYVAQPKEEFGPVIQAYLAPDEISVYEVCQLIRGVC